MYVSAYYLTVNVLLIILKLEPHVHLIFNPEPYPHRATVKRENSPLARRNLEQGQSHIADKIAVRVLK